MPKLVGGSAYGRPRGLIASQAERPFDPDDLPLEAERSAEDRELAAEALERVSVETASANSVREAQAAGQERHGLRARPFRLRLPGISKGDR